MEAPLLALGLCQIGTQPSDPLKERRALDPVKTSSPRRQRPSIVSAGYRPSRQVGRRARISAAHHLLPLVNCIFRAAPLFDRAARAPPGTAFPAGRGLGGPSMTRVRQRPSLIGAASSAIWPRRSGTLGIRSPRYCLSWSAATPGPVTAAASRSRSVAEPPAGRRPQRPGQLQRVLRSSSAIVP